MNTEAAAAGVAAGCPTHVAESRGGHLAHSNHVTSSKQGDTLICHTTMRRNPINFHTTMRRNPINFLYSQGHVTFWCVEVGPVANATREGSTQEVDQAGVQLADQGLGYSVHAILGQKGYFLDALSVMQNTGISHNIAKMVGEEPAGDSSRALMV